jgi:O-antigen/teichoic acid export membrane protein
MIKVSFGTLSLIGTIIVMIILADTFMTLLFTKAATAPFQLLLVSMIFFVASIPIVSLVIYYLKKPKVLSVNSILQVIIVIVGNFILIPKFGKLGPAISLILSYGITLFTTAFYALIELKRKHA